MGKVDLYRDVMDLCRIFRWVVAFSLVATFLTHLWLWANHGRSTVKEGVGWHGGTFQRIPSRFRNQILHNAAMRQQNVVVHPDINKSYRNMSTSIHSLENPSKEFPQINKTTVIPTLSSGAYDPVHKTLNNAFTDQMKACYNGKGFFTDHFCLPNDTKVYFKSFGSFDCLIEGTDILKTIQKESKRCVCKEGWNGFYCNVPDVVEKSDFPKEYGLGHRKIARRIIYAFPFNHEFDLLEAKFAELNSVVDVFLILESNYTASGNPKERLLLQQLRNGFLEVWQNKIVYISLDYFPPTAYANGWIIDELLRNHIGYVAFGKILTNVMDDDIFILSDVDEIPRKEALLFLKVHYGYLEPFGFTLKHTVFGFFWKGSDGVSKIYGGCSIKMLREVFHLEIYLLRSAPDSMHRDEGAFKTYYKDSGGRTKPWVFGSESFPAGWHCSWCLNPEGIQNKLLSAHAGDYPRWGSDKKKTAIPFIKNLIKTGTWFDETTRLEREEFRLLIYGYAPEYVFYKPQKYSYILDPPWAIIGASTSSLPYSSAEKEINVK